VNTMTKINLKDFCSTDETRPMLHEPFSCGDEWTYATDGRIMIRVLAEEYPSEPQREGTPKVGPPVFPWNHAKASGGEWVKPTKAMLEIKVLEAECNDCDGEGRCECPHCMVVSDCTSCDGSGKRIESKPFSFHQYTISTLYIAKSCLLPGVEYYIDPKAEPMKPILIRFDGGLGYLMGMKKS